MFTFCFTRPLLRFGFRHFKSRLQIVTCAMLEDCVNWSQVTEYARMHLDGDAERI